MDEQEIIDDIITKIKKIGEWKHRGALMDIKKVVYEQLRKPENKDNFILNFLDFYISGLYEGLGYYYELKERDERKNK